jgi:hypothetical protein
MAAWALVCAVMMMLLPVVNSDPMCLCGCGDGPSSKVCTRCIRNSVDCSDSPVEQRCWYKTLNGECKKERFSSGQFYQRGDCCAEWILLDFESLPRSKVFEGVLYVKDPYTHQFASDPRPLQPPMHAFPGLLAVVRGEAYDNTTCIGRCCKTVLVTMDPAELAGCDVGGDWRTCVRYDDFADDVEFCRDNGRFPCKVWVPCEANGRLDMLKWFGVLFGLSCLLFGVKVLMKFCCMGYIDMHDNDGVDYILGALYVLFVFHCIVHSLSLCAVSDVDFWVDGRFNEVDLAYASYQACSAFCNANDGRTTFSNRFCAEDYSSHPYAIWPGNRNHVANVPCEVNSSPYNLYCIRCDTHRDDWSILRDIAFYLGLKVRLLWISYISFFCVEQSLQMGGWVLWSKGVAFWFIFCPSVVFVLTHFFFFVVSAVCMGVLDTANGLAILNDFASSRQAVQVSVRAMWAASAAVDFVSFVVWVFCGWFSWHVRMDASHERGV